MDVNTGVNVDVDITVRVHVHMYGGVNVCVDVYAGLCVYAC